MVRALREVWDLIKEWAPVWLIISAGMILVWSSVEGTCGH